jgi:hypothetical protein
MAIWDLCIGFTLFTMATSKTSPDHCPYLLNSNS